VAQSSPDTRQGSRQRAGRGTPCLRAVKRITRPMLGCKAFAAAHNTLVGIELLPMIKKRQLVVEEGEEDLTAAALCYALVA
jgi:hypothetical protein